MTPCFYELKVKENQYLVKFICNFEIGAKHTSGYIVIAHYVPCALSHIYN